MIRARGIQSVSSPSIRWPTTSKGLKVSGPSEARIHGSLSPSSRVRSAPGVRASTSIPDWRSKFTRASSAQKVLDGGDYSHRLMQLRLLTDARSLISRQNDEYTLARLADAAQGTAGVAGELLRGGTRIGRRGGDHRGFELVEAGEYKRRPADAELTAGGEHHAGGHQLAHSLTGRQYRVGIGRAHDEGLLNHVARPGALGLKAVGKRIGDLESLELDTGGIDPMAAQEGKDLPRLAADLGPGDLEIVSRRDKPQRPERQVPDHLLLRQALHLHVRLSRPTFRETPANERTTQREAHRNDHRGSGRAQPHDSCSSRVTDSGGWRFDLDRTRLPLGDTDMQIEHDVHTHRFTVQLASGAAVLSYAPAGKEVLDFFSTYVPPADRGRNVAGQLVEAALAYARAQGFRVIP